MEIEKIPISLIEKIPLNLMPLVPFIAAINEESVYFRFYCSSYKEVEQIRTTHIPNELLREEFKSYDIQVDIFCDSYEGVISMRPPSFSVIGYFKDE